MTLKWETKRIEGMPFQEAQAGDLYGGDGVRFTLEHYPTCYRRGPYKLLIEVCGGVNHERWGCFDEADAPLRWFHHEKNAKEEAEAIAKILWRDRYGCKPQDDKSCACGCGAGFQCGKPGCPHEAHGPGCPHEERG